MTRPRLLPAVPRRMATVAAAIALAAVVASCAAGDPEITFTGPSETTPELARSEFVARANVTCREAERQIASRTEDHGPTRNDAGSRDAQAELVEAIEPVARQAIAVLRNLTPPAEDAATIRAGLDKMEAYLDRAKADPTISIDPIGLVDQALYDYGLTNCFSKG